MFEHMRNQLLENIDPRELPSGTPSPGVLARLEHHDEETRKRFMDRQVDLVVADLNRESTHPDDLPVAQGQTMADAMRYYGPYGFVSSQVGRLSAKLFALKMGLPVLAVLPISLAQMNWQSGLLRPPLVTFDRAMYTSLDQHVVGDGTAQVTLTLQLTLIALRDLEESIDAWERRDLEMREILHNDPLLNQRQRSILARALRNPESEFLIRYHQRNHTIHYTTARRDLLELQEKGYLVVEQRANTFVFLRGRRLDELEAARASKKNRRGGN